MELVVKRKSSNKNRNSPGDETEDDSFVDGHDSLAAEHVVHTNKPV